MGDGHEVLGVESSALEGGMSNPHLESRAPRTILIQCGNAYDHCRTDLRGVPEIDAPDVTLIESARRPPLGR